MRVFGCFLLFHMLFDFYFQSNKMAGPNTRRCNAVSNAY